MFMNRVIILEPNCIKASTLAVLIDGAVLFVSSFKQKATTKGLLFVRVVIKGLGPGRLVS